MFSCPNCGSVLKDGILRCPACGAITGQSPLLSGDYSEEEKRLMSVSQTSITSQKVRECLSCGAMFPYNPLIRYDVCPICGESMNGVANTDRRYKRWTAGRAIALFCLLLTIAASFMPFFTYTVFGISASISLWSKNYLAFAVAGAIIVIYGIVEVCRNAHTLYRDMIVLGVLILADIIFQYVYNKDRLKSVETGLGTFNLSGLLSPGSGFFLMVLASIGMIVSGFVIESESKAE